MIETEAFKTVLNAPLSLIAQAQSIRNPNPFSQHVLSNDVIHRAVEPDANGHMHVYTTRILRKKGKLPEWAPSRFSKYNESWICEKTDVDLDTDKPAVRTCSVNMDKRDALIMHEFQEYIPAGSSSTNVFAWYTVDAKFTFPPFRRAVEKLAVHRAAIANENAMRGIWHIAEILGSPPHAEDLLRAGPLQPYPFRTNWLQVYQNQGYGQDQNHLHLQSNSQNETHLQDALQKNSSHMDCSPDLQAGSTQTKTADCTQERKPLTLFKRITSPLRRFLYRDE